MHRGSASHGHATDRQIQLASDTLAGFLTVVGLVARQDERMRYRAIVALGAVLTVLGVVLGLWVDGVWLVRLGCLGLGLVTGAFLVARTRPSRD